MHTEQLSCLAEIVREQMNRDWRSGKATPLEAWLSRHGELADSHERLLDLVYAEFRLAQSHGRDPDPADYARRFPQIKERVARLFAAHRELAVDGPDTPPSFAQSQSTTPNVGVVEASHPSGSLPPAPSLPGAPLSPPRGEGPGVRASSPATNILPSMRQASRYRPIELHAKGGLGEVFLAKDLELPREVALKEIQRQHANHPTVRSRFIREAEITGALEHPGIVPIYGLGAHDDGRPYYAMRFVRGESLKEAIDRHHQSKHESEDRLVEFRKLLGRFVDVCNAVGYAHSRGVLHRDLKPGNVMLGKFGETLVVDWGLAKPFQQPASASAVETIAPDDGLLPDSAAEMAETRPGSLVGTLAFMPPEQAAGNLDQIGPASDVYSLGATLYCLLTGQPPFTGDTVGEIRLKAERSEFPRPRSIAPHTPKALEAICLKAMSPAPRDRYVSPLALADDVERWLADEPVSAWREPALAQARRWLKRRPALTAGSAVAAVMALAGLVGALTLTGAHNRELFAANEKLGVANRNLKVVNDKLEISNDNLKVVNDKLEVSNKNLAAANAAEKAARKESDQVLNFMVATFRRPDPSADGRQLTIADMLTQAVASADEELGDRPRMHARLLRSIGETYIGLGLYGPATAALEKADALAQQVEPLDADLAGEIRNNLAIARQLSAGAEAALPLYRELLDKRRAELGEMHPQTLSTKHNLAYALRDNGQYEQSIALFEETLAGMREVLGKDHTHTLTLQNNLASALRAGGRFAESAKLAEQTVAATAQALGENNSLVWRAKAELAIALRLTGETNASIALHESILPVFRSSLGENHPDTLVMQGSLATAYQYAGRYAEATAMHEATWKAWRDALGAEHLQTLGAMNELALAYAAAQNHSRALELQTEQLALIVKRRGADHPDALIALSNLANAHSASGHIATAIELGEQVLPRLRTTLGEKHPTTLIAMRNLGLARLSANQYGPAKTLLQETLDREREVLGERHPQTVGTMASLAAALRSLGQNDLALPLAEQSLRANQTRLGPDHLSTIRAASTVASIHQALGRLDQAIPAFESAFATARRILGDDHPDSLTLASQLGWAYKLAGQSERAEALLRDCHERELRVLGPDHPETITTYGNVGGALIDGGKLDQALPILDEFIDMRRRQVIAGGELRFSQTLLGMSRDLLMHGEFARAQAGIRECLALRQKHAADDWSVYQAHSFLGAALAQQALPELVAASPPGEAQLAEAEQHLLEGYRGMEARKGKLPPGRHRELIRAAWRLVKFYSDRGRTEEVSQWKAVLEKLEREFPEPPSTEPEV